MPTQILLVEDNLIDARATIRVLEDLAHPHEVEHVVNGSDALTLLARHAESGSIPDLILLDLNASGIRGLDVLQVLQSNPMLRHVPTVILSTSDHELDIEAALQTGARAYFVKPRNLDDWADIVLELDSIVASTSTQPTATPPTAES